MQPNSWPAEKTFESESPQIQCTMSNVEQLILLPASGTNTPISSIAKSIQQST